MSQNPYSKKRTFDDFQGRGGRFAGADDDHEEILFGQNDNQDDAEAGFAIQQRAHFAGADEASEDNDQVYQGDEEQKSPSDEIDGEDLDENMENDYQRIEALDRYDSQGIDD